ncbi:MAG: HD-GYP domain-containing protein, partial [Dehalococcoidia bacterium]
QIVGATTVYTDITGRKQTEKALKQSYQSLERLLEQIVGILIATVEMRDPYTAGHQRRVALISCAVAKEMGLSDERIEGIRMAALVHDVGKIQVPAEILSKPAVLSEIEMNLIKCHPQFGYDALKAIEFPWPVARIVLEHHERLNSSGYPYRLAGVDIMLEARIIAVADVVEAMSSHRPYRPTRGIDAALAEIQQNRGTLYDPAVVDACVRLLTEKGFKLEP